MERDVLMRRRRPILLALLACLYVFNAHGATQTRQTRLLLVCGMKSAIPALSNAEVRKVFLGAPVEKNGVRIKPLRNVTDTQVTEVFLQKIVYMSARKYERQLVARVFRQGGVIPKAYESFSDLVGALQNSPATVSYMSSDQLAQAPGVKSIGVLWDGPAR